MCKFKKSVAKRFGIKAAAVAQFLWDSIEGKNYDGKIYVKDDKKWCRCSHLMMSALMPYLTKGMVSGALELLQNENVIKAGCFNRCRFDRTNWYTFTEYGRFIMDEESEEDYARKSV